MNYDLKKKKSCPRVLLCQTTGRGHFRSGVYTTVLVSNSHCDHLYIPGRGGADFPAIQAQILNGVVCLELGLKHGQLSPSPFKILALCPW